MTGSASPESLSIIIRAAEGLVILALAGIFLAISFVFRRKIPRTMEKFTRASRVPGKTG